MADFFEKYIGDSLYATIAECIFVILCSIIIYKLIIRIIEKSKKFSKAEISINKKGKTYLSLIRSCIRIFFIVITVILILQISGVDVSSLLAGVGILGIIVGLAIQDWLRDILRGSTIITDKYCAVGDVVKFGSTEGVILSIGIFTTKIRDIGTGNIVSVANRKIEEIAIVSNQLYLEIPVARQNDTENIANCIKTATENINSKNDNNIKSCRYLGISNIGDFSISHLIEIICDPAGKSAAKRAALQEIIKFLPADSCSTIHGDDHHISPNR